jgi:Domain of unknown function (DUF6265)
MKKVLLFCLSALVLLGCSEPRTSKQKFKALQLLEGKWASANNMIYFENWKILNDSILVGKAFSLQDQDTLFLESLQLVLDNNKILYQAKVGNQNKGRIIPFVLNKSSGKTFVFENPEHDYPQRIIYQIVKDSLLNIRIETMKGTKSKVFNLKKKSI